MTRIPFGAVIPGAASVFARMPTKLGFVRSCRDVLLVRIALPRKCKRGDVFLSAVFVLLTPVSGEHHSLRNLDHVIPCLITSPPPPPQRMPRAMCHYVTRCVPGS